MKRGVLFFLYMFKGTVDLGNGEHLNTCVVDGIVYVDFKDILGFLKRPESDVKEILRLKNFRIEPVKKDGDFVFLSLNHANQIILKVKNFGKWPIGRIQYRNAIFMIFGTELKSLPIPIFDKKLTVFEIEHDHPAFHRRYSKYGVLANDNLLETPIILGYYAGILTPAIAISIKTPYMVWKDGYYWNSYIGGNESRMINDYRNIATEPNCKFGDVETLEHDGQEYQALPIILIKPLKKGDELLIDYGEEYWKCMNTLNDIKYPVPITNRKRRRREEEKEEQRVNKTQKLDEPPKYQVYIDIIKFCGGRTTPADIYGFLKHMNDKIRSDFKEMFGYNIWCDPPNNVLCIKSALLYSMKNYPQYKLKYDKSSELFYIK